MIEVEQIKRSISLIAAIDRVEFDSEALADDALVLTYAFPEPEEYAAAIRATARALQLIVDSRVNAAQLHDDYNGWSSYHYQHRINQGSKADMRIMFRRKGDVVQVRGFGHRRMPADFYRRMSEVGRGR